MKLKRPVPPPITFTEEGLQNLKLQLQELLERRPAAIAELQRARELGDLSENGLYKAAKGEVRSLDGRIARMKDTLKRAKVVTKTNNGVVEVGSKVLVDSNGVTREFHIVGDFEADPTKSKISQHSPIGKALLGKKIGEKVEIDIPSGKLQYVIVSLN